MRTRVRFPPPPPLGHSNLLKDIGWSRPIWAWMGLNGPQLVNILVNISKFAQRLSEMPSPRVSLLDCLVLGSGEISIGDR